MSTLILQTACRLLVPLSLLFSLFMLFKGHQLPGGGFVAGLVLSVATVVHRMAAGRASLAHLMVVRERTIAGAGLLIVVVASTVPVFFGLPFMTTIHGYIPLPGADADFHLASVLVFDVGVMLVVAGVVVGMINALSDEME
ncbi:MAG: MnhB domain-containing protein [Phycisphaerae bacterium]